MMLKIDSLEMCVHLSEGSLGPNLRRFGGECVHMPVLRQLGEAPADPSDPQLRNKQLSKWMDGLMHKLSSPPRCVRYT